MSKDGPVVAVVDVISLLLAEVEPTSLWLRTSAAVDPSEFMQYTYAHKEKEKKKKKKKSDNAIKIYTQTLGWLRGDRRRIQKKREKTFQVVHNNAHPRFCHQFLYERGAI